MPALQVRDFPQDLYDRLCAQAKLEHRSIAQQTVACVERDLNNASGKPAEILSFNGYANKQKRSEETPEERIARRKRIFAELDKLNAEHPWSPDAPSAVEIVRIAREEAYARLGC